MAKWLPFKSLKGQYEVVAKMKKEREKQPKPELCEDEAEALNETLLSLRPGDLVQVTFYGEERVKTQAMIFRRLDSETQRIFFRETSLALTDLLGLQIR
ncbi:MAG: YolD-like family protein [Bacilli bacterium]|jgi:hypothetical protein|nr:YolD-like family protein [Bacilli bacterium]